MSTEYVNNKRNASCWLVYIDDVNIQKKLFPIKMSVKLKPAKLRKNNGTYNSD